MTETTAPDALLTKCYVVQQFHDDGHATLVTTEGVIFDEAQALPFLQAVFAGADIRRADCEHVAFNLFVNGKETDTVWLTQLVPCAGQAHAAELLEALEFYADPEMWMPHRDAHSPIDMDDGKIARAALAATKGAA